MTTFVCFYDLTRLIDYLLLTLAHVFKKSSDAFECYVFAKFNKN